jgi:hypothetical protein
VRLLVRSEQEAFRLTVAVAFAGGISVLVGYLFATLAGVALFAFLVLLALLWDLASIRSGRSTLREAADTGHGHPDRDGRPRILVIANETVTGDALEQLIRDGAPRPILDVVAPVLQSRTHFVTTDIDRETAAARRRLRRTLQWAAEHDIEATGVVGDPIAPLAAIEDELRRHDFDEVILAMHPQAHTNWLETQLLERTRAQLSIPVRRLVIGSEQLATTTEASS